MKERKATMKSRDHFDQGSSRSRHKEKKKKQKKSGKAKTSPLLASEDATLADSTLSGGQNRRFVEQCEGNCGGDGKMQKAANALS